MVETDASYRREVLFVTTLGAFMAPFDGSIVSVALPSIASAFRMDYAEVIWVPVAYLLCLTALLLTFGRLSDIKGRKSFFTFGFLLFTIASAFCGLSQNGAELIICRGTQGVGAAMISATSAAIVTEVFPSERRGRALGVNTLAVYTGLSVGPTLGGVLVQTLGWRSIFYVNIPIGIVVIAIAATKLKVAAKVGPLKGDFDFLGATSFIGGLSLVLLGLTLVGTTPLIGLSITGAMLGGLGLLAIFLIIELRRGKNALLDLSLFRGSRLFAAANLSALLNYTTYFAVPYFLSFYLQRLTGYSPLTAGLILISMPVPMALLSPISGWLSDRFGSRFFASIGMGLMCASLLFMSQLGVNTPLSYVVGTLFMMGIGMGLFSAPNTSSVMGSVERPSLGAASGTLSTMRFMGQSLSLAVMAAVAATVIPPAVLSAVFVGSGGNMVPASAFLRGESRAFLVGAAIALVGTLTSTVRGNERRGTEGTHSLRT
jgi:EmrB/QacA subfamily drug resistance transporter